MQHHLIQQVAKNVHAEDSVTIYQIACDASYASNNFFHSLTKKHYFYQLQSVAGIVSFAMSHPSLNINVEVYTTNAAVWSNLFVPKILSLFKNIIDLRVNDISDSIDLNDGPALLAKVKLIHLITNVAYKKGLKAAVYLDGDHISVYGWFTLANKVASNNNYCISMAYECGLTFLEPIPNFNSGMIWFKPTKELTQMCSSWIDFSIDF